VTDTPAYERLDDDERHFDSRVFAPFDRVHRFERPLHAHAFACFAKITRQGTLTSLDGEAFDGIRELLSTENALPPFVTDARIGRGALRDVTRSNWRDRLASSDVRFIHESQLRAYLIDYLLDEVRDSSSPRLEECACFRGGQRTGFADYMVQLGKRWVPVEAKLNVHAERNLLGQVARYTGVDAFTPTRGSDLEPRTGIRRTDGCIVIDQAGLYVVTGEHLVGSDNGPLLMRDQLCQLPTAELRTRLLAWLR
jgi:hypothetical protein